VLTVFAARGILESEITAHGEQRRQDRPKRSQETSYEVAKADPRLNRGPRMEKSGAGFLFSAHIL
jgi:hypothetical protein